MHTHLTPSQVTQLLHSDAATHLSAPARERLQWIATFVQSGRSVSDVCAQFNIARSTFHRWLNRFDPADLQSLEERSHEPHVSRESAVPECVVALIRTMRNEDHHAGKEQIHAMLLARHAIDLSSSAIGRIIERECLYFGATPLHWRKRSRWNQVDEPAESMTIMAPAWVTNATHQSETASITEGEPHEHHCNVCAFWKRHWTIWKRTLLVGSALANLALIAAMIVGSLMEYRQSMRADLIGPRTEIHTTADLDGHTSLLQPQP